MSSERSEPRERAPVSLEALFLFAFAWLWLSLRAESPLHDDSSRDFAFARDLADGVELHLRGASTSFAGLEQGALWIDLLALCRRLGLGILGVDRVLTTLLAGSVAAVHYGVAELVRAAGPAPSERLIARAGPLAGALAWLASLPVACQMPVLWQPLLLPVLVVLAHLALWRVLERGELLDALAAGILCALAFDVHVVAIVLLAALALVVPLGARRPGIATPASLAAALGLMWLSSSVALTDNLEQARAHGWVTPGLAMVGLLILAGLLLRSRFAALSLRRRLELAVAVEALLVAAVVLASWLPSTPALAGRYLLPFCPGLALAVALVIGRGGGTRTRALVVTGLAALLLVAATPSMQSRNPRSLPLLPEYTQREFEAIADALDGHTWNQLIGRLQGPDHDLVLSGLSAELDPGEPISAADTGILLISVDPNAVEPLLTELPSATRIVAISNASALLIETPARLDRTAVSLCAEDGECTPVTLYIDRRVHQAYPAAWRFGRPASEWLGERSDGPVRWVSWRFPVRPGPAATLVLPPIYAPHCAWQIVASEGFELAALPTSAIELPPEVSGSLTIARVLDEDHLGCKRERLEFPPAPIELEPGWTRLRALLLADQGGS